MKGKRTNFIVFSRQLWPQPPYYSRPYWWGIGDLSFYDKNHKCVWHQEIPEASNFFNEGFYNWLNVPRFYIGTCWVERSRHWGWILKFKMSHKEAAKIWAFLFKDHPEIKSHYEEDKGQHFVHTVPAKERLDKK